MQSVMKLFSGTRAGQIETEAGEQETRDNKHVVSIGRSKTADMPALDFFNPLTRIRPYYVVSAYRSRRTVKKYFITKRGAEIEARRARKLEVAIYLRDEKLRSFIKNVAPMRERASAAQERRPARTALETEDEIFSREPDTHLRASD